MYCGGVRSCIPRSRLIRILVAMAQSATTRIGGMEVRWVYEKRAEVSIWRRGVYCFGYFRLLARECINRESFYCIFARFTNTAAKESNDQKSYGTRV